MLNSARKIKVLVVDDSAIVRKILSDAIAAESDLELVGTAPDPFIARDKILALQPDVLTLDIEMPRMDGLTFLKKLMQYHPMPVIVISSLGHASCQAAVEALRYGAVEVLAKPQGPYSVGELRASLIAKLRAAARSRPLVHKIASPIVPPAVEPLNRCHPSTVIAIGASTGGTQAIREVLAGLPPNPPGIVVTQHIPPVFSTEFAKHLNEIFPFEVKEASQGDEVFPGRVLIAPGNFHMLLRREGYRYWVQVQDGPQVCYQRPSVDVLFSSVADSAAKHAIGVLLTGMGADGGQGLLRIKRAGGNTIAQDEQSSVVYGMPREAARLGAADQILPLHSIAKSMLDLAARMA
ncbi:MAG TPA: chemotaxis response regulator protein-glutamate methylesterase [Acidisarcina sp.]|nr:chemotaxis response regulator protein-glutamate methylesterase [Acidisarcina sp.]